MRAVPRQSSVAGDDGSLTTTQSSQRYCCSYPPCLIGKGITCHHEPSVAGRASRVAATGRLDRRALLIRLG
jgi:hypothetical protein